MFKENVVALLCHYLKGVTYWMKIYLGSEQWISEELRQRCNRVEPATIGHYLTTGFMHPRIKSVLEGVHIVGQALTVSISADDSVMVHKAVSMVQEGEIIVIDRLGDGVHACVGEMVVYAAKERKAAGIIIDGPSTDVQAMRELGVPVFSTGFSPITTKLRGHSGEINTTIHCGGVVVKPGDLIIADDNGVLVIPKNFPDLDELLLKAETGEKREAELKKKIDNGETLSSLTHADQILKEHGIL